VVLFLLVVPRMAGLVAKVQDQATQLAALAHNDGLTGIPNRRAWELELPREMARVRRHGGRLLVALLDLDHFKRYNDHHGHQGGDRLLKEATGPGRPGCAAPTCWPATAVKSSPSCCATAPRPRAVAVLCDLRAVNPDGQTFSAGVAEWDGQESPEGLVGRADRALYEAKHAGRDRIIAAPSPSGRDPDTQATSPIAPETASPSTQDDTRTRWGSSSR